jgi:hypothetical protein
LGQVQFSSDCGPSDESCLTSGLDAPIAVGAALPLDIDLAFQGTGATALELRSVDSEILSIDGRAATGVGEGLVAVLVLTSGGRVLDFVHLSVEAADGLALHRLTGDGLDLGPLDADLELLAGDALVLEPRLVAGEVVLLGQPALSWQVTGDAVSLLDTGLGSRVEVRARKTGLSTVTASAADLSATLSVEVLP